MVADALHDVADHLGVEEADGQFHQFDEKIGNDGDVDTGADVEQNPRADEFHGGLRYIQCKLRDENEGDKAELVVPDTVINNALGEEWEDELEQCAEQHAEEELHDEFFVGAEVLQYEAQFGLVRLFIFHCVEIGGGFQQQGDALVLPVVAGAEPAGKELLHGEFDSALCGVGHEDSTDILVSFLLRPYVVHHHKMVLFPVYDAGQWGFCELCE